MSENKFDKEKISMVSDADVPVSYLPFTSEKMYDIRNHRENWWQCPKCGGSIEFECYEEQFDDRIGKNQLNAVYSWECVECGAEGSVYAAVKPLYISIVQEEEK